MNVLYLQQTVHSALERTASDVRTPLVEIKQGATKKRVKPNGRLRATQSESTLK
jgi:hypothetical protein